jgi:outer membrane receptor protein involved in Fe transport
MKQHHARKFGSYVAVTLLCLPTILWGQLSNPAAPAAAPSSDDVVKLPQFEVSETEANSYRPTDALSVNRTAGSIMDAPLTVNVLTSQFMSDIGATSMFDATRYMAGISAGRAAGTAGVEDRTDYRGFESFGKTIDNFSGVILPIGNGYMAQFDPSFIDRVELVMGPDSILAPTGSPGGSANIITKSPQFKPQTLVTAEVGNFNAQKLMVDNTGAIGDSKHWAYRVIGSFQDTKSYMPGEVHQANAGAELEYDFDNGAKVTLKYFMEKWQILGSIAANADNGNVIYAPNTLNGATLSNNPQPGFSYNGWGLNAAWNTRSDTMQTAEANFQTPLGSHVTTRLAADVMYDNYNDHIAFPKTAPAEIWDPATGRAIGFTAATLFNPASVPINYTYAEQQTRQIQVQNDYAGQFKVGGVSIQPVVGWATQQGEVPRIYQVTGTLPTGSLVGNPTGYYNPAQPPITDLTSFSSNHPDEATLASAYALARVGLLHDHVFLTGGASRTWATVNDYSFKGVYIPGDGQVGAAPGTANYLQDFTFQNTGSALAPTQKDYHDTHLLGVLVKPVDFLSIYASNSTNAGIASATPLWQAGTQYEFGVKTEFFDQRLQVSADHFQITEANVSANNPLFSTGQSTVPNLLLDETNHGYEVNVQGGLTENLSIIASFTEMHLRDAFGRRLVNVPDTTANLFLNYRFGLNSFLRNVNVFGGVNYEGNVAGETVTGFTSLGVPELPGFYLKPYEVFNVGAGYGWGPFHYNLNIDNLLNSKFWWEPAGRISVAPYPGIGVRLTVSYRL